MGLRNPPGLKTWGISFWAQFQRAFAFATMIPVRSKQILCRLAAVVALVVWCSIALGQNVPAGKEAPKVREASNRTPRYGLQSVKGDVLFDIKNVDITHFPEMSVIFSAVNNHNQFIRTLKKEDLLIMENGIKRQILSLDLVSQRNRVPIDIVFVIDQTASMRDMIGTVKQSVSAFADQLRQHGFDFHLGMVRFSDIVEWTSPTLTDDVPTFEKWVNDIETVGGGDVKENALEGLHAVSSMPLRPIAMRLAVLITDAQCHLRGEHGDGTTDFTIQDMGDYLYEREIRLITITPPEFPEYHDLAQLTEGASFNLGASFNTVLDNLTQDITSLYALRYLSQSTLAPDSVRIGLLRAEDRSPLATRKLIALEPGRRFVFDDLLFAANQASLVSDFDLELERVVRLMYVRPTMRIRVEGYADSTGSDSLNMRLSQERAEAVKRYLVQSGIQPDRLETIGYAATRPIATNETEEGRKLNRRIEFVILTK
jgi:outer membrane protein OmpA-like peptidoglycan-associated protein